MTNIEKYETKEVECVKCGWVGTVAKFIPIRQAWCGSCRSSQLRIHHAPNNSVQRTCFNCGGPINTSTGFVICERGCGGPVTTSR